MRMRRGVDRRLGGPNAAFALFKKALQHVAKSGEVWCEGGRLFLNPCSGRFDVQNAVKCLNFAVFFTPQYGDSFLEVGAARRCEA